MTSLKILVTGATGGVGAPLVAELLAMGLDVRAVVRLHDARSARLAALGAEVVVADLYDPDQQLCGFTHKLALEKAGIRSFPGVVNA